MRSDQNRLINAFREKHGLEPEDCCVDIRRFHDGRLIWNVRKMSVSEREAQRQLAVKSQVEAIKKADHKTYVFGVEIVDSDRRTWSDAMATLFHRVFPSRNRRNEVWLTELGAKSECGKSERVVKLEVRA